MTATQEKLEFRAELKQLLHLIAHSLYSHREVFLRELISNASDAINRLKFDSLDHEEKLEGDKDYKIKITPDKTAGTLTVSDNGIGMSRGGVVENLGTIARSGTRAFLEGLKERAAGDRPGLIGQFGVGFYSSFMVADRVTVRTRLAGTPPEEGVEWSSDGQGEFIIAPFTKEKRGTDVVLHLKDDAKEFLEEWQLRALVRKFSDFIEYPVVMDVEHGEGDTKKVEEETLNARKAIWLRPKNEVTPEEYKEFYQQIAHDAGDPAKVIHYTAEGAQEFKVLLFIPAKRPLFFQYEETEIGPRLYVQRVLIMEHCPGLITPWLRFVRGVVDSADLPLNVSREILQQNPLLEKMKRNVVGNVLSGLEAMKNVEFEKYVEFFKELGMVLKEGVGDWSYREKVADLLLFESAKTEAGKFITLEQYVGAMPEGQTEIYYLIGESREPIEHSPYLEAFRAKGYDVLLLTDPAIDEFLASRLTEHKGKRLRPVDQGELPTDAATPPAADADERFKDLLPFLKGKLPEVSDVRLSKRLTESAACLVAEAGGITAHMERLLQRMGRTEAEGAKRVLELNPNHPAVLAVQKLYAANPQDPRVESYARLLLDQAVVAEGSKLRDPVAFARRVNELLARDAGV
jgi:molecular chaperone HtpG